MYQWDMHIVTGYFGALISGLAVTIQISAVSIVLGTLLGLIVAIGYLGQSAILRQFARAYVTGIVALPLLVLMVWIYYIGPTFGIKLSAIVTAILALTLSLSGFVCDLVRSGIHAIPKGQVEVARTHGLAPRHIARHILCPQVLRTIGPALFNEYVTAIKLSTVASVIAAPELLYMANIITTETYHPLEAYTIVALIFVVVTVPLLRLGHYLERYRQWRL